MRLSALTSKKKTLSICDINKDARFVCKNTIIMRRSFSTSFATAMP